MSAVRETGTLSNQQPPEALPESAPALEYGFQTFNKNTFEKSVSLQSQKVVVDAPTEAASPCETEGPGTSSFWKRLAQMAAWLVGPEKVKEQIEIAGDDLPLSGVGAAASGEVSATSHKAIISPVPVLDPPDMTVPIDLGPTTSHQPKPKNKKDEVLSAEQFQKALSLMSERTIEEIMAIILKAQLVLEQENAEVAKTTHDKYEKFRELNQNLLQEIKDALVRDEKVAGYLKTSRYVALVATAICGMAAAAISFNLPHLVGAGPLATGIVQTLSTVGGAVSGTMLGLVEGSKVYFDSRVKQDEAKRTHYSHKDKTYADYLDDSRNRLIATAEADHFFKERLINQAKRIRKMSKQSQ